MNAGLNRPIIIKRKKVSGGGGHHGGAWKVAYADFVTAMMAFFLLMWLLNASSEQQRAGLADYFAQAIPLTQNSAGGDGVMGGDSIHSRDTLARADNGGVAEEQGKAVVTMTDAEKAAETQALRDLEEALLGLGGETMLDDNMMRHIVTRLTDEGLVIELFDLPEATLFEGDTATPTQLSRDLAVVLGRVLDLVRNNIAVTGHVRQQSVLRIDYPVWDLSTARASAMRGLLEGNGLAPARVVRQTGKADRAPSMPDPQAIQNNRIELVVLRSDRS